VARRWNFEVLSSYVGGGGWEKELRKRAAEEKLANRRVQKGDILAVHIEGLSPAVNGSIPLYQVDGRSPVSGHPMAVGTEKIYLPILGKVEAVGKTTGEIRQAILDKLKPEQHDSVIVEISFLLFSGENQQIKNLSDLAIP
jgi:protein involved in polysaccharide export with SLBB domain